MNMANDYDKLMEKEFFENVPFNVMILDKDRNVVRANTKFEQYFGIWQGKKCHEVCKKCADPCHLCKVGEVFNTGEGAVFTQSGFDCHDQLTHYIVYVTPIKDEDGNVIYIIKMSLDLLESGKHLREYNFFFENSPNFVTIVDEKFNIVRANRKFREVFGETKGKKCFEVYKKRKYKCRNCPAFETFTDGLEHASAQSGISATGDDVQYVVTTNPLSKLDEKVVLVLEIATDITEINHMQAQMTENYELYTQVINSSPCAVVLVNASNKLQVFNTAAKKLFAWKSQKKPTFNKIKDMMPPEFFSKPDVKGRIVTNKKLKVINNNGKPLDVLLTAVEIKNKDVILGRAAIIQQL